MNYLLYFLKLLVPALSMCGIMLVIHDRLRLNAAFLPLVTVSVVTLAVYIGGMLGILPHTVVFLYTAGLLLFVWEVIRIIRRKCPIRPLVAAPAMWFFIALCVYFIFRMRGVLVLHVDNFSHWATIIKEICITDAFPATGSAVSFRNYAPGSAAFIYFVCKATGFTEGHALAAQGIILAASMAAVFCKAKYRDPLTVISLLLAAIITVSIPELSSASLHIYNFLVDGLIAYITAACGIIAYAYRDDLKRCLITLIPITSMLTVIKTSARLFAILIAVMVLIQFRKKIFRTGALQSRQTYLALGGIALLVASQLIFPALWNTYITGAFPDKLLSDNKFPTTVDGLLSHFASKDAAYLKDIASEMLTRLTDMSDPTVQIMIVAELFAVGVLVIAMLLREKPRIIVRVLAAANLTGIFYLAELFVLYGFIFDEYEASILASFYRYTFTGQTLLAAVLFAGGIYQIAGLAAGKRRTVLSIAVSAVMIFGIYTVRDNAIQLIEPAHRTAAAARQVSRQAYREFYIGAEAFVPPDSTVIQYDTDTSFFVACLPGYELLTTHYTMLYPKTFEDPELVKQRISRAEYIVVADDLQGFRSRMAELGFVLEGDPSATVYMITQTKNGSLITAAY